VLYFTDMYYVLYFLHTQSLNFVDKVCIHRDRHVAIFCFREMLSQQNLHAKQRNVYFL
jgi:hypothetical protein